MIMRSIGPLNFQSYCILLILLLWTQNSLGINHKDGDGDVKDACIKLLAESLNHPSAIRKPREKNNSEPNFTSDDFFMVLSEQLLCTERPIVACPDQQ
jgi:hypothetical protein